MRSTLLLALFLAGAPAVRAQVGAEPSAAAGEGVIIGRSVTFQSTVLAQRVRLDIALPPDYAASRYRYPVLFGFQTTLAGVFGVVDTMTRAAAIPGLIVVVAHVPGEMFGLYPRDALPDSGRAAQVLEFLRAELEPYIDATYRTVPYRIVLGHSASALFSLWAMFSAPDAIQAVLAAGPMFAEFDYERVAGLIESALVSRPARTQFLFFTQGNQPELTRNLGAFGDMLRARKPAGLTWEFDPEPLSNHNSLAIRTLHDGLWKLYADWSMLPETVASAGGAAIQAHRKALAGRFGYDIGLGSLADSYVRAKWTAERKHDSVIALARSMAEEFSDDPWQRRRLALAFENAGRWEDAASAWEAAIAVAKDKMTEQERKTFVPFCERRLGVARSKAAR